MKTTQINGYTVNHPDNTTVKSSRGFLYIIPDAGSYVDWFAETVTWYPAPFNAPDSPAEAKSFSDLRDLIERRKQQSEREAQQAAIAGAYETMHMPEARRCECGVDKAGVGGLHSDWCPKKADDV